MGLVSQRDFWIERPRSLGLVLLVIVSLVACVEFVLLLMLLMI